MKALHIRLYTGDIRSYLRPDQLKATPQGVMWRSWVAWEQFPKEAGSGSLKLAARTTLKEGQAHTEWTLSHPAELLKYALERLVSWLRRLRSDSRL